MEVQDLPVVDYILPEPGSGLAIEADEMDRIALELWQHGSMPDVPGEELELESVACHASCL